ncbi:MAG: ribose-phosphate diphosphokinase [Candidatus Aenigmarchaeota archaeon]|nr:ribose-phosphate diphosphokinase [Candidatus Aenigmarchaeota archaeon]
MIVVGCDGFSRNVAKYLGESHAELERKVFDDGELCPRLPDIPGKDVLIVSRIWKDPNSFLVEALLMARTLKEEGKNVFVFAPYLPYTRQDKAFRKGEPASLKYILEMLAANVSGIFTVTSHHQRENETIKGPVTVHNINGFEPLVEFIKEMGLDDPVIVGPDARMDNIAKSAAEALGTENYVLSKERNLATGEVRTQGGMEAQGRSVVIIDDIVGSGRSMLNAATIAKRSGASRIICACVHPVFSLLSKDSWKLLLNVADEIVATNTIESEFSRVKVEKYAAGKISVALQKIH